MRQDTILFITYSFDASLDSALGYRNIDLLDFHADCHRAKESAANSTHRRSETSSECPDGHPAIMEAVNLDRKASSPFEHTRRASIRVFVRKAQIVLYRQRPSVRIRVFSFRSFTDISTLRSTPLFVLHEALDAKCACPAPAPPDRRSVRTHAPRTCGRTRTRRPTAARAGPRADGATTSPYPRRRSPRKARVAAA